MAWTAERIEILKSLWAQGLSAAQIAGRLEGVSRNAVIGKLHRLDPQIRGALQQDRPSRPRSARVSRLRTPAAPRRTPGERAFIPAVYEAVTEAPGLATCVTLQAHMCKWPIGHPDENDFTFCGRPSAGTRPYCERHVHFAYKPARSIQAEGGLPRDLVRLLTRYG